jgi:RimJ/RimL family protein N-acetyltransferase
MIEHMTKWDNWFYAVFLHDESQPDGLGEHIGSVSLRHQSAGPELPPPQSFERAEQVGTGKPLTEAEFEERNKELQSVDLNLRVLGYALFAKVHGKGYGTEACKALLDGYAEAVKEWKAGGEGKKDEGKTVFYVEAGVDQDNPGSQNVLRKLGFKTVGMKIEKEKAWLNGGWRGPGWWITGMYL